MSSKELVQLAMVASQVGAEGAEKWASIAATGLEKNFARDFLRHVGRPRGTPKFYMAGIPVVGGVCDHPFLLPHALFGGLYHHRKEFWMEFVSGEAAEREQVLGQLAFDRDDRLVPIGLHWGAQEASTTMIA